MAINGITIPLSTDNEATSIPLIVDSGSPYYVGAKVTVEQTENGAIVTAIDKDGITTAVINNGAKGDIGATGNGISSVTLNPDYTLTIEYTSGDSDTTSSVRGEKGEKGEKGDYNRVLYKDVNGYICADYDLI